MQSDKTTIERRIGFSVSFLMMFQSVNFRNLIEDMEKEIDDAEKKH